MKIFDIDGGSKMKFHRKPITYVNHVAIKVTDLERSLKFYQEMIGFDILERTEKTAKLTTDGKRNLLSLEQPDGVLPKQGRTTGLYHFAILLPKKEDLANIVAHFLENNIRFGSSDHLVSEALYLYDPDGNQMEIYIDRDSSEWNWNGEEVVMAVDPLDFERLLEYRSPNKKWTRLPKDTLIGHIHLHVSELKKTEEFYVKGLGMDVVNRFGGQALFLSYGKYHHHVAVNTWNGVGAPAPAPNSAGLESFTLLFDNEEVLAKTISHLKQIDANVAEEEGTFVTTDPSGNRIKLVI